MLLEELINTREFPYFRNQKLFVLPPEGEEAFFFYNPDDKDIVEAKPENGLGLHCMVLEIEHSLGRVKVRFFGNIDRPFIVKETNVGLVDIEGVENLSAYTSREFFDTYGRTRLDIENGVIGWLTFDNIFMALESDEYVQHMRNVTSSEALTWEDGDLGGALDAYTSSASSEGDLADIIGNRLGGTEKGSTYLGKIQRLLPSYGGRRKADRGRLHTDYGQGGRVKRKERKPQANTKIEQAVAIYRASKRLTREEVVQKMQKALGVTHSNASTYFSKAKGIVEGGGTKDAWEKSGY